MRIESGRWKGRALPPVTGTGAAGARPAGARLRKSVFSVLAPRLEGARVLDLFAGAGTFGLEAASRGAAEVILVERDATQVRALQVWLERVGPEGGVQVLRRDVLRQALPEGPFDVVFLDPPFDLWAGGDARAALALVAARLAEEGVGVVKLPVRQEIPTDDRWQVLRRSRAGASAWVLLGRPD